MLNLPRPTSWYFETCRQILWCRLTYDKLYILYSDEAQEELMRIWRAAILRAADGSPFVDASEALDSAIQADDKEWRAFLNIVENAVAMQDVVDDYFHGDDADTLITEIEGGGYRAQRLGP